MVVVVAEANEILLFLSFITVLHYKRIQYVI